MHRIAIGLLMLAYCLPAAYATLWADTARDLGASLTLAARRSDSAHRRADQLRAALGSSVGVAAGDPAAVLSELLRGCDLRRLCRVFKFPLLYALGRRHSGPALGLAIAAAAAYPTFNTFQWIVFFHPNWVGSVRRGLRFFLFLAR
jgi:hypothetical protein